MFQALLPEVSGTATKDLAGFLSEIIRNFSHKRYYFQKYSGSSTRSILDLLLDALRGFCQKPFRISARSLSVYLPEVFGQKTCQDFYHRYFETLFTSLCGFSQKSFGSSTRNVWKLLLEDFREFCFRNSTKSLPALLLEIFRTSTKSLSALFQKYLGLLPKFCQDFYYF